MNKSGQEGFSLVEVLVALAILGGASAVLTGILAMGVARHHDTEMRSLAESLAHSLLAQVGQSISLPQGERTGHAEPDLDWTLTSEPYGSPDQQRNWPVKPRQISVSVRWKSGAVTLSGLSLETRETTP